LQLQDLLGWLGHHHLCPIPQKIAFLQPHKYPIKLRCNMTRANTIHFE
jgi:hypothetical protein